MSTEPNWKNLKRRKETQNKHKKAPARTRQIKSKFKRLARKLKGESNG